MRVCFISASEQNVFFDEMLESFRHALGGKGIQTETAVDHFPAIQDDLVYVFIPHEFMPLTAKVSHPTFRQQRRSIAICTEQPGTPWHELGADMAVHCGATIDIHPLGTRDLWSRGIAARFMQLGYTPLWDHWKGVPNERSIDATFMGGNTNRRSRLLGDCAPFLVERRSSFHLYETHQPHTSESTAFFSGARKWDHLLDSKVIVNVHRSECSYFEWQRVIGAISNGCIVLTEHSIGCEPLVPGHHFLSSSVESMPAILNSVLGNPDWQESMRQEAYEFITTEIPMSASIEVMAQAAEDVARVPMQQIGPPSPAIAMPVKPTPRTPEYRRERHASDVGAMRMALKLLVQDVRDLKRELAVKDVPNSEAQLDQVITFGPYDQVDPKVSVVVTLYNYEHVIGEALESVARSDFDAFEVVIVEDASTDGSLEAARRSLESTPWVPAKLIARDQNGGLPSARNLGARYARGDYLFILDADNMIYPHALKRLTATLDAHPKAAFAYGIIEDFASDGCTDLRNWIDWSPERLLYGNFIDAMSMIRRSALLEVGGYMHDRRIYGWEDFDLWCTFADYGFEGVLVPEIVARYRTGPHSMISITNIDDAEAWAALVARHPCLAERREETLAAPSQ